MATPAIRALRKRVGPQGKLIGVMRPYVADVLAGSNWLDEVVLYTKRPSQAGHDWRVVRRHLQQQRLDRVVLLPNSLRTAWMAWQIGAPERVGYAGRFRAPLLTKRLRQPKSHGSHDAAPPIDAYLQLAYACGCAWESPRLELATTREDEERASAVWKRLQLPAGDRVVVFNSGGAYGGAKHWPAEHFADLARRIVRDYDLTVLVNCGPAERRLARHMVSLARSRAVVSLADESELPIGLTKACIRRSRMLVTTDSGPRFFGVAFGLPVVSLFGPTAADTTRTHYPREISLSLTLECQPCMQRVCPLVHHHCMQDLSVDTVLRAVRHSLASECDAHQAA